MKSGGSHGGTGGCKYIDCDHKPYGDFEIPLTLGSAGSAQFKYNNNGGGRFELSAETAVINGRINMDGQSCDHVQGCSAGSGGSIYIRVTTSLTGSGLITANGGNGSTLILNGEWYGGGGGGGRIGIVSPQASLPLSFGVQAYGGSGFNNQFAGAGTIFIRSPETSYRYLFFSFFKIHYFTFYNYLYFFLTRLLVVDNNDSAPAFPDASTTMNATGVTTLTPGAAESVTITLTDIEIRDDSVLSMASYALTSVTLSCDNITGPVSSGLSLFTNHTLKVNNVVTNVGIYLNSGSKLQSQLVVLNSYFYSRGDTSTADLILSAVHIDLAPHATIRTLILSNSNFLEV